MVKSILLNILKNINEFHGRVLRSYGVDPFSSILLKTQSKRAFFCLLPGFSKLLTTREGCCLKCCHCTKNEVFH